MFRFWLQWLFRARKISSSKNAGWDGDQKFREVMALPIGLKVTHVPEVVQAEPGGRSGSQFTWNYLTSVETLLGALEVVEFGAFGLYEGKWWFGTITGEPFSPETFASWYSCPGGIIREGICYFDPCNFSGGERLEDASSLWYFIARDAAGKRFRGAAMLDTEARIRCQPVPDG